MMRSLKDRNYAQVLTVYEAMVEASVPPDLLALNCIIEAKARAEGSAAAQQTLQVRATFARPVVVQCGNRAQR